MPDAEPDPLGTGGDAELLLPEAAGAPEALDADELAAGGGAPFFFAATNFERGNAILGASQP